MSDNYTWRIAEWNQAESSVQTSRMISRVGVSPPPPPGPPPNEPPPLPPTHPYAGLPSRRQPPTQPIPPLPSIEPTSLPSSVTGHRRTISASSSRLSNSPPRVSPRSSSLMSPSSSSYRSHESRPKANRTPSRHLLQTALDLAQRAVEMDKSNDVVGALAAYREAVDRLKSVMERVGVESHDNSRRKSGGRTDEEGRTLRGIHDAYVARIVLLSSYEEEAEESDGDMESHFLRSSPVVPQRDPEDRIPRQSFDDTATGIGNLMLNDESSPRASADGLASPHSGRINRPSSIDRPQFTGSPIQPPPRRTSMAAFTPTSPATSFRSSDSLHNVRRAVGLEQELDIPEEDEVEVLSRTPQTSTFAQEHNSSPRRGSEPSIDPNRPLPPLPNSAPLNGIASPSRSRQSSSTFLVSPNVNQSTLVQRRLSRGTDNVESETNSPRSRTRSQPGPERGSNDQVPPLPSTSTIRHRTSFGSRLSARIPSSASSVTNLRINTDTPHLVALPFSRSSFRSVPRSVSGSLVSPAPEPQPTEIIQRSFHILRVLCISMDPQASGAYLTAHVHISPAIWQTNQFQKSGAKLGPPKIIAQDVKYRLLETLCFHLDIIRSLAGPLVAGERDCQHGENRSLGQMTRAQMIGLANDLVAALDAMDEDMQAGYKALTKSGVQVQSWNGKKKINTLSWGSKLKDKMTNGKVLESPDKYVDLLSHFSFLAQTLNEHLLCLSARTTAGYACLPEDVLRKVDLRVINAAQFFSAAIVPFILEDTMQFIARYLKAGMKYLED